MLPSTRSNIVDPKKERRAITSRVVVAFPPLLRRVPELSELRWNSSSPSPLATQSSKLLALARYFAQQCTFEFATITGLTSLPAGHVALRDSLSARLTLEHGRASANACHVVIARLSENLLRSERPDPIVPFLEDSTLTFARINLEKYVLSLRAYKLWYISLFFFFKSFSFYESLRKVTRYTYSTKNKWNILRSMYTKWNKDSFE